MSCCRTCSSSFKQPAASAASKSCGCFGASWRAHIVTCWLNRCMFHPEQGVLLLLPLLQLTSFKHRHHHCHHRHPPCPHPSPPSTSPTSPLLPQHVIITDAATDQRTASVGKRVICMQVGVHCCPHTVQATWSSRERPPGLLRVFLSAGSELSFLFQGLHVSNSLGFGYW